MKNIADLETRLLEELDQWITQQSCEPYADFYLYYRETTPEYDGNILILPATASKGSEYQLAMPERISKGATVNQNFNRIRHGILRTLPVLS